jgi:Uma2 family endonuclease
MQIEQFVNETTQATATAKAPAKVLLPPLENGDTLTRAEFERRYHAMPRIKKAELIEGKVYMPSPVRRKNHSVPDNTIAGWLFNYSVATPGVSSANNGTVRLDEFNEPQPDADLRIEESCGGQSSVSEDDYLEGAPELVVEIAASSASHDLREKLAVYQRNGVREYIVWATFDQQVHWFELTSGAAHRLAEDENGVVRSQVFPGLWLNIPALLRNDRAELLQTLQQGLAADEHQAFVQQLAQAAQAHEENG